MPVLTVALPGSEVYQLALQVQEPSVRLVALLEELHAEPLGDLHLELWEVELLELLFQTDLEPEEEVFLADLELEELVLLAMEQMVLVH